MRLKEFQRFLKEKKIDFALLFNVDATKLDTNMFYFSGYKGIGALVIPAKKNAFLVVPEMEYTKAKKSKIRVAKWGKKKRLFELVRKEVRKRGIRAKEIGIDKNVVTLLGYSELKNWLKGKKADIGRECSRLRLVKTKEEIKRIRKSCGIASEILKKLINEI